TGVGTVVGVPDTAVFSVGVQVVGTSPGDVLNESRARSESVQEALRNLGIRERNIQTTHYNMHTERYPTGPDQRPTEMRYVATTGLRIDLTDLDRLDEVFSTATSAGATELWGIQFGVSDSAARHDEARVAALEDARRKAEELAAAQGLSIVAVDSISTNQQAGPGLFEGVQPQGRGAAGGAVSPGELEFREAVTVTYTAR
ncbi:MAG: SIMPL domain-containing protein, partial [bacterium]